MVVRGILSSVRTATRAANQALLLSERVLFLVNRMPSLWRLQARLGARELMSDALKELSQGPEAPIARLTGRARHVFRASLAWVAIFVGALTALWMIGLFVRR
jgi:hypothetical protein